MKKDGTGLPNASSRTAAAINATFGSLDNWLTDFKAVGGMRGVGWAILRRPSRMAGRRRLSGPDLRSPCRPVS